MKAHDRRLRRVDPYQLSPGESASYWSGEWIGAPVPSKRLRDGVTDEQAAAEDGHPYKRAKDAAGYLDRLRARITHFDEVAE